MDNSSWKDLVKTRIGEFARRHKHIYSKSERQLSGYFEIGCFLSMLEFYERLSFRITLENLVAGTFRYLTTPAGDPRNFSFVSLENNTEKVVLRQQVRVRSKVDSDIAFTPDILVLAQDAHIEAKLDADYAKGRRKVFSVDSDAVISAHECKSMNPFPELLVSFLGIYMMAHSWVENDIQTVIDDEGSHLAPSLFVGGSESGLHRRMIDAMRRAFPINIITGMHAGTWNLLGSDVKVKRIRNPILGAEGSIYPQ